MKDIYSWLKRNKALLIIPSFILVQFFPFNDPFGFIILYIISFVTLYLIVTSSARISRKLFLFISIFFLAIFILLFDNILIPEILKFLRFRYIFLVIVILFLLIYKAINPVKVLHIVILLNFVFITFSILQMNIFSFALVNPVFTINDKNNNPISEFISKSVDENRSIVVALLDGYPSSKILKEKYDITNNIDSILYDFNKIEFMSRYTSTPISVTNLLFNAIYTENTVFKNGQDEIALFKLAYEKSSIFPLSESEYCEYWYSFLASEKTRSILGYLYWDKKSIIRSFFNGMLINFWSISKLDINFKINYNKKIIDYNNYLLNQLESVIKESSRNKFIFIHFLTFHTIEDLDDQVKQADKLVKSVLSLVPTDYSIVFFSDHGVRTLNNELDKKAGIYYQRD